MLEAAYTSLHLWSIVGQDINIARGHWLFSRAQVVTGNPELAFLHAQKFEEFTNKASERKEAFGLFYLNEAFARVYAMKKNIDNATSYVKKANSIAANITDKQTQDLCFSDLRSGPWFGFDLNL